MATVLVVDDHDTARFALARMFRSRGHRVIEAASGVHAVRLGREHRPHGAIVDVVLPGVSGFHVLTMLRERNPEMIGIAISGVVDSSEAADECRRAGFAGYFSKPVDQDQLIGCLEDHLVHRDQDSSPGEQTDRPPDNAALEGFVGESPLMRAAYRLIARIGPTDATVLIEGESGTGKELAARAIHNSSERRGPFVAVNCAAIPRELAEAELFGSERGAFTEAVSRSGRFEHANGGTLFLDEIGDLALSAQGILLRVLDQKTVVRLGSHREVSVDVRVIAATNVDLATAVREGRFRGDLLYRLRQIDLEMPPLRVRGDDFVALIDHFLPRVCTELKIGVRTVTSDAISALQRYTWPGNVRELRDVLMQACARSAGPYLTPAHLPKSIASDATGTDFIIPPRPPGLGLTEATDQLCSVAETQWIREALRQEGTVTKAAAALGVNRKTLQEKMAALGIRRSRD